MPEDSSIDIAALLADYVPKADYEAALEAINEAIAERDAARGDAEKHTTRLQDLEKTLRGRTWRDAFDKIADEAKVKKSMRGDVFDLLKLAADNDQADEPGIKTALQAFLKDRPDYVDSAPPRPTTLPAGEGSLRGRSVAPGEPELRVTRQQLNDAVYMRDNQSRISAATRAGLLVIDD